MTITPRTNADGLRLPRRGIWKGAWAFVPVALLALSSGCNVVSGPPPDGHFLIVDQTGAPLRGAVIYPENEDLSTTRSYFSDELHERTSNAQGTILVHLEDFFWRSDSCYHFRVSRAGFEDENMTVSRDLFPQVLRIDMRVKALATEGQGRPRS